MKKIALATAILIASAGAFAQAGKTEAPAAPAADTATRHEGMKHEHHKKGHGKKHHAEGKAADAKAAAPAAAPASPVAAPAPAK